MTITLEDRIRSAYGLLADRTGQWISLVDIRLWLQDVPRAEVDAALEGMARRQEVCLIPEANQKTLTQAQREAALHMGGQNKHSIGIW